MKCSKRESVGTFQIRALTQDILSRLNIFSLQSRKKNLTEYCLEGTVSKSWNRFVSFQNARVYQITQNSQAVVILVAAICQKNPAYFGSLTEASVGSLILVLTIDINSSITHYLTNTYAYLCICVVSRMSTRQRKTQFKRFQQWADRNANQFILIR